MKRKICVVTSSRADYGLLRGLLHRIEEDQNLELQIIATGMHLPAKYGHTYKAIEKDGFKIDAKIDMLLANDSKSATLKAMGLGLISFADYFENMQTDLICLLGDRFEIFAVAQAAMVSDIPIAHLHGGELTTGAFDDSIRHSITKLSHLHFCSTETYRERVIQMGEDPDRVFNFGAPGLENLEIFVPLEKAQIESKLNFSFRKQNFLITVHAQTLANTDKERYCEDLFTALEDYKEAGMIFTGTNADTSHSKIDSMTKNFVKKYEDRCVFSESLGSELYHSVMHHADAVIGNSSSGIYEAPFFKVPTVNIGDRQGGRLRSDSVIDCKVDRESIRAAITQALSTDFQEIVRKTECLYFQKETSKRITEVLKNYPIENLKQKKFYDLPNLMKQ